MKRTSEAVNNSQKKARLDPGWTTVEKRKKKQKTGSQVSHPRFMYSNHDILRRHHAVSVDEIRDLVLHLIVDAPQPNWLRIENLDKIQRVVVLLIPGLTSDVLQLPPLPTSSTSNPNLPISIPLEPPPPPPKPMTTTTTTRKHRCDYPCVAADPDYDEDEDKVDGENRRVVEDEEEEEEKDDDIGEKGGEGEDYLYYDEDEYENEEEEEGEEEEYISTAACIPFIASTFSHACPTRAPGDSTRMHSVHSSFFTGPISSEVKKRKDQEKGRSEVHAADPTQYVLTVEQMIENDYPIPSYMADVFQKPDGGAGWLETPKPGPNESKWNQKIYAVDCEMCETEDGKELTRVCVIDFASGTVVYDRLVKPAKPILDYLTKWSGITPKILLNVTTTLEQVQDDIMRILTAASPASEAKRNPFSMDTTTTTAATTTSSSSSPPGTPILVGHSLESDLKALKICHPRCIDTAIIYHHPRGRPLKPGLAWLTKKWCGRQIQVQQTHGRNGGNGGHDPEEDARACVDLLRLKMENGPGFGEYKVDYESIFERMGRCDARTAAVGGKVKSAVIDHGHNPGAMHGAKATTAIGCKTDEEVLEGLLGAIPGHQFVFGRFTALAGAQGWITPKATTSGDANAAAAPAAQTAGNSDPPPLPTSSLLASTLATTTTMPAAASASELAPVLRTLNEQLQTLHRAFPARTAFLIFTGHSDPRRMAMLNARKSAFEKMAPSSSSLSLNAAAGVGDDNNGGGGGDDDVSRLMWSAADARELEGAVELARRGLMFLGIKQ